MCGISGFIGKGDKAHLVAMAEKTWYRGPDFIGHYFDPNLGLGMAHNRLSIIDLSSAANQPFFSKDKQIVLVFNGEIYNFQALKSKLQAQGYGEFETTSDTEVLIASYQMNPDGFLQELNGMFSFVLFDYRTQTLFAAVDRFGEKPLYFSKNKEVFAFASEPKALLEHPNVPRNLNLEALQHYLTLDYIPSPLSIYEGIHRLQAGYCLKMPLGQEPIIQPYYQLNFETQNLSFEDAKEQLDHLLDDATKIRMISDVPLGVFLSGGLDSSTIAYYAQKNSMQKIATYSIGFEEKSFDERAYAQAVSKKLGTQHHELVLTAKDSLDLIPKVMDLLDEPFADPSILPTYLLSAFTRKNVTVALGGDGSDELLYGYPTFITEHLSQYIPQNKGLKSLGNLFHRLLPKSDQNISLDFKIKQYLKGYNQDPSLRNLLWLGSFSPEEHQILLQKKSSSSKTSPLRIAHELWAPENKNPVIQQYINLYLQDDILYKVDRASMFNSLEVRAPFLDVRVADFINQLPKNYKFNAREGKFILKKLMGNKLPSQVIWRPKKGFGIPLSQWLRHELKPLCEDLLSMDRISAQGIFNPEKVQALKTAHFSGKANTRKELWNLMVFQWWYQSYMNK